MATMGPTGLVDPVRGGRHVVLGETELGEVEDLPGSDPDRIGKASFDPTRRGRAEPAVTVEDQEHGSILAWSRPFDLSLWCIMRRGRGVGYAPRHAG